ncbi:OmpA family protein [Ameyamaea chiangmaiensis]|uniref:OmpA family protein n=1 Tax=Ameyamaea chiangmaiensis TaxID=442969 RepID=A0A850P329_9PROT|nr:OmpA family protein [Ameyamaea chiangmaiensis]MBS4073657.1 OmpA family protein [Ameyamaea chiangmaiensis]NVN39075.1 OmpA family protein [Ameyamaea chiangmaiensis]
MRRLSLVLGLCVLAGCSTGSSRKYVVFFTHGSAALDETAQTIVSHAAATALAKGRANVIVEGYAAAHGDLSADELLAMDRARIVADQLARDGVAPSAIRQAPRAPSNENVSVAARRVEIEIVAQ